MTTHVSITRERARQIAVMAQRLDSPRPTDILATVEHLGFLQIDPTAVVARTEELVLWSRIGNSFRRADLTRLVYVDHELFEHSAFIFPKSVYPSLRPFMEAWPEGGGEWRQRARQWLIDNASFSAYVLAELKRRGPLKSRDLEDRSVTPWVSTGWTNNRNVNQMLEFLEAKGKIAVAGRERRERLWDLAERVMPVDARRISRDEANKAREARRLRSLGLARADLVGESGLPAVVEGVPGQWRVDAELLDRPFTGRTAILSPFDRLPYDRVRLKELFDFDYKLEMYVPAAKRIWGYYVLPCLVNDRFAGRVDAKADRTGGVLRILSLHLEPGSGYIERQAIEAELGNLAAWLGLRAVEWPP